MEVEPTAGQNPSTSLIIIDEDELNLNNESQVIQRIIEEYERRLQEQLALARQDIVAELEQQIQVRYGANACMHGALFDNFTAHCTSVNIFCMLCDSPM